MPVTAIVNPVAGRQHGAKLREVALTELNRLFPGLHVDETSAPGHGIELSRRAAGSELVIAVGGDGTVREVASGIAGTGTPMAVIPVGSGNDFLKTVGIPADVTKACAIAKSGTDRRFDMVRLSRVRGSGVASQGPDVRTFEPSCLCGEVRCPDSEPLLFVNAAGFGFDAAVVSAAGAFKRLRGLPLYVAAVFSAVRSYECPLVRITKADSSQLTADSQGLSHPESVAVSGKRSAVSYSQRILLIACANGRYYGGGMKIAPEAKPDDGLLEVCVAEAMGRLKIIRYLPRLVAGTHVTLPEVRMLRCPRLELEVAEPTLLQLDGDLQHEPVTGRFVLEVLPGALTMRV